MSDAGPALFRLVRFWSRRRPDGPRPAIQVVTALTAAGPDATVGDVAHQLGIDHSGASRFVRDAVADGFVVRASNDGDRRRAALVLTPAGEELLATAEDWQRATFARLVEHWPAADRKRFGAYLERLADEVGA